MALLGGGVEEVLDRGAARVAADERRLETRGAALVFRARRRRRAAPARADVSPSLPLSSSAPASANAIVCSVARRVDSPTSTVPGSAADWHAGGGVDEIAGDHALAARADRDGGLAGQHPGTCAKAGSADLVPERRDGGDEVERGTDGALGVVLGRDRRSPDGHHRIADELLDRPAVAAR